MGGRPRISRRPQSGLVSYQGIASAMPKKNSDFRGFNPCGNLEHSDQPQIEGAPVSILRPGKAQTSSFSFSYQSATGLSDPQSMKHWGAPGLDFETRRHLNRPRPGGTN